MAYSSIFGTTTPGASPAAPRSRGYSSIFGGTPVAGAAPAEDQGGFSIGGFLGNLGGGVKDVAVGLGSLAQEVSHDIGRVVGQVSPIDFGPFNNNPEDSYHVDDILKNLGPAIVQDYSTRYGPAVTGHPGEFGRQLYEKPLSFILDALGAGAVAGKAAEGAGLAGAITNRAGVSAKALVEGSDAANAARLAATDTLLQAGTSAGTSQAAGLRAGLDELVAAGQLPESSIVRRLLPSSTYRAVGDKLLPAAEARNPVTRAALAPIKRLSTEPVTRIEAQAAAKDAEIQALLAREVEPSGQLRADTNLLHSISAQAKDVGVTRIEKPFLRTKLNPYRAASQELARLGGEHLMAREQHAQLYRAPLIQAIKEDPTVAETFHITATGLDVELPGLTPKDWAVRRGLGGTLLEPPADIGGAPVPVGAGVGPGLEPAAGALPAPATAQAFGDTLDDIELQAATQADPAFTARAQGVQTHVEEFIQQFEAQRQTLTENGWEVDAEIDAARRLNRGISDGLRRRTAATRGEVLPPGIAAQDELRVVDAEQFSDLFSSMARTPSDILNRAYFPMRFKYGAHFEGDVLTGGPSVAELDDALRAANHPQPIYFPYEDAERAKKSAFFRSTQLRGANIYAKDPHAKQLRGVLLREGTHITDPVEAYTRRAAHATREIETYRTQSTMVKTFGRLVTNAEDIPHGYVAMSPDLLFLQHRSRLEMLDNLDDLRSQGIDADAALAEVTNRVTLRNQHDVEVALAGKAKIYAVPEHVAKQMQRASDYARVFSGPSMRLYWDQPIKLWRSLVLTASPRWIVNNVLGNSIFAAMQGVKTADVVRMLGERMRALLAGWLESKGGAREALGQFLGGGELREGTLAGDIRQLPGHEYVGSGFVGSQTEQYQPRLGAAAEDTTVGRAIGAYRSTKVGQRLAGWGGAVRHLNGEIEAGFRDASFLTAIEKQQSKSAITRTARSFWSSKRRMEAIMRSGFDESRARLALAEVNHFYGDYSKSTPFERHIIKRFIFPFWGFYRHQLKLITSFPWEYPAKAQLISEFNKVEQDLMDQYGPVPGWLEGAVPLGPPGSEVTFLTSRGADPFSGTFQSPASMLSPPVKLALEQSLGRSLFTGQEFTDENVVAPFGSSMKFRADTGEPVSHVAPSFLESFLQTVPQYQMAKQVAAGGKTYDTASLLDVLRGQGVIRDPETGAPAYPTTAGEQLAKLVGFPTSTVDLQSYQEFLASQQEAAMREAAKRQQAVSF